MSRTLEKSNLYKLKDELIDEEKSIFVNFNFKYMRLIYGRRNYENI